MGNRCENFRVEAIMISYRSVCVHCNWGEKHRTLYVACLLIATFSLNVLHGSVYTYGNIQPYLVSYIRARSIPPSTLRYTESTYLYSTQYASCAVGIALGGFANTIIGARMSILFGGTLSSLGLFLSYYTIQHSFWLIFVSFGLMYSMGTGMVYFVTIACVSKWVRRRTGMAVGFVIGGVAMGSLGFGALQTAFVNRKNDFPNDEPYEMNPDEKYFTQVDLIERVPLIFIIEGVICLLVTVTSLPFIANPLPNDEETTVNICCNKKRKNFSSTLKKVTMNIFCRWLFYFQWLVALLNIIVFGVIASLYKTYGIQELKLSDHFLTALGAVASGVCSFIGRILFGVLADKFGYKMAYILQNGLMAEFALTLYITSLGYPIMYFLWVCGIFMCYGGYSTLLTIAVLKVFGSSDFNMYYAVIATSSQIVASFLYGIVSDFCVDYLDWSGTFLLIGCLAIVQTFLILAFPENESNTNKKYTFHSWSILYLMEM